MTPGPPDDDAATMTLFRLFQCSTMLLSACLAFAVAAQAPRKLVTLEGVTEYRFDNGMRVLAVPDSGVDTMTVHLVYLVGSRHEGYGEKGMAHLLEHMLFKGSAGFPDIKAEFQRRGARWNGTTSADRTTYFETFAANEQNLDWALALEADRMLNSFVTKADLDSEMTVVRNEFERGENNPGSVLTERMKRLSYTWHNYGSSVIGARSDIENVPIERLRAFYRTWYQPDNAVLIIAGRFEESRALDLVAKHFGALPRPVRALPRLYTEEPTADGERTVTLRRAGETPLVAAMYRIPSASHPGYPAIEVLMHALATVPNGRLHQALVQQGLATRIWGYEETLHDPGQAVVGAGLAKDGSVDAVRDTLLKLMEGLHEDPIRQDEMERAKISLMNDFERVQMDTGRLVRGLSDFSALGDWRLLFLYRDRLQKVTLADVQAAANAYFKPANRVLGVFMPTAAPDRAAIPAAPDLQASLAGYQGNSERQAAGEIFVPTPENIEARVARKELPNRIRAALFPKKTRGERVIVHFNLHLGNEASRINRETACSLAGAMLMRGTLKRSRGELRDALERLNASVSVAEDGASIDVRRDRLSETLALVAEILKEPSFPREEFDQLKRAWITSTESRRGDPASVASERLARHLYPYPKGHPRYTETLAERVELLNAAKLEDAISCYRDLYGATDAELIAVGDFDPAQLVQQVEALFGTWRSRTAFARVPAALFASPPLDAMERTPDKANAVLRGGLAIRMRDDHPDYPALLLGNYLLGGSSTARLPGRVREKEGLSYSTYTSLSASPFEEVANFSVAAIFAPQNRDRVERAVREELERALREGFAEDEVRNGAQGLLESRRLSRTQDQAIASRLGALLFARRTYAWERDLDARIAALSAAQVSAALRRHLDPARLSIIWAGDFQAGAGAQPRGEARPADPAHPARSGS